MPPLLRLGAECAGVFGYTGVERRIIRGRGPTRSQANFIVPSRLISTIQSLIWNKDSNRGPEQIDRIGLQDIWCVCVCVLRAITRLYEAHRGKLVHTSALSLSLRLAARFLRPTHFSRCLAVTG